MALVLLPYWSLEFTFQDNNGNTASTGLSFAAALTFDAVEDIAVALAPLLAAVSDAELISWTISRGAREDTPVAPPASSEVERKLVIPLNTAQRNGAARMQVPSPIFGIELAGTDIVDRTNLAVSNLLDYLVNGGLTPGNGPTTYYGADIISAGDPYISHRNRRARKG